MIGRSTRQPKLNHTNTSQKSVANVSLAQDYYVNGENGTSEKRTRYVDFVAWDKRAQDLCANLAKGRLLFVKARVQPVKKTIGGKNYTFNELIIESYQYLDNKKDFQDSLQSTNQQSANGNGQPSGLPEAPQYGDPFSGQALQ